MKKLKMKRYTQGLKSVDCGPVATQSILDYFGVKKNLDELKKDIIHYIQGGPIEGTYIYDNGLLLLKNDLSVTLITANPYLFSSQERSRLNSQTKILNHLKKLSASRLKSLKRFKKEIQIFRKFIEKGGKVVLEIPTEKHIKKAIDSGKPVLALVLPRAYLNKGRSFHFVVISGYDAKNFYFVDPWPETREKSAPIKDFMYGLHSATGGDLDNGSLLVVGKK